ncbi:hypothetical protein EZS27_040169 [termite gut metagenome]|uniref:Uncharacterized protein n=1 Tax=termite gut metagenome TaxID=433724 RepID=A0A5J4PFV9_9ZZZZ
MSVFRKERLIRKFIKDNIITEEIKFIIYNENTSENLNVGFNKKHDLQKELLIDMSNYLLGIEGFVSIKKIAYL